jgi:hypothetical protein
MKIFDRYSLLCISISLIIITTVFINGEEPEEKDTAGIAYDIKTTQNGYTFSFDDGNKITRCFTKTEPKEYELYLIKGSMSDDGSMLFVSSMQPVDHE